MTMSKKLIAEAIGTFWLVLGGCGSAVLAAKFGSDLEGPFLGIGLVGVSLAFGLTVLTMAYALVTFPVVTSTRPSLSACGHQSDSQPRKSFLM